MSNHRTTVQVDDHFSFPASAQKSSRPRVVTRSKVKVAHCAVTGHGSTTRPLPASAR